MKTIFFSSFIILILLTPGCNKESDSTCQNVPGPAPGLLFQIKYNDTVVHNANEFIRIYYQANGVKTYINDIFKAVDSLGDKGIFGAGIIGTLRVTQNIKTFYIEYLNNWSTDTVVYDMISYSPKTNCQYLLKEITYNNQIPNIDTLFNCPIVYVFNKTKYGQK